MNALTFEAEPFELSPQSSAREPCDCPKCRAARESSEGETFEDEFNLEQRVPPGGGFFQREFAGENEAADFELPESSDWEAVPPGGGRFDRELLRARAMAAAVVREVNIFRCPRTTGRLSPENLHY